jgi:hypothetical protein
MLSLREDGVGRGDADIIEYLSKVEIDEQEEAAF